MNYIILNGKESSEIKGLMICSLPPISKPAKRVNIEEIDGVDGDTITEVGYKAYDKEITIGLTYNYDVDEVIEYFNSEGVVTFSNEPDKYYKYNITEQIDLQRLIKFKTATVKFHIQPFKFSNEERNKTFEISDETEISVRNNGNIYSKPILTIHGTGTINLSLNNEQIFVIELGEDEENITIDIEKMEAYNQATNILKNRLVTGNYDNFKLKIGKNIISFTGTVTKIIVSKCSRWI